MYQFDEFGISTGYYDIIPLDRAPLSRAPLPVTLLPLCHYPTFLANTWVAITSTFALSSGATSSVYGAVDREHSAKYAIKCISKSELSPKQLLLRCPHVLPLKEIIDNDLYMFIVFDLRGGDLFQAIWGSRLYMRNNPLIKETFLDILDGVYACHARGVFHRDLKPENILCGESGTDIQIADFGLATRKRICRGSRCGTPDYMSPEQWAKNIVYYPSLADIWSLGIILLNLVTGRRPWKFARVSDIQFRAFLDDENYLYNTFPISRELNMLLKWILCPNPMGRLQILQIREAILKMDTFYRIPWPSGNGTLRRPRRVTLTQELHFQDCVGLEGPSDEKRRTKRRGHRPIPQCPGRGYIREMREAEKMVGMTRSELPLALHNFGWRM
ncbi:kinase-like domain-containing protein [Boletus edulis]|nr:kinase-like domain-containing protein [Boletus edulis]